MSDVDLASDGSNLSELAAELTVERLDEARERLGLKTRVDLFRKSLADYLTAAGEHEVAQLCTEQA